jgi:competence ComEA-like helix-hairpin-helix protein
MKQWLIEQLYYTLAERKAILVLLVASTVLFLLPRLYPRLIPDMKTDFSTLPEGVELLPPASDSTVDYFDTSFAYAGRKKYYPAATLSSELFSFDPNLATEAELKRLGLPERVVRTMLNFRGKGGTFRKKEDLAKIYGLSTQDFERLLPYIVIAEKPDESLPPKIPTPASVPKLRLVDINQATEAEWQLIPGIGPAFAKRIVNFREKLGGFINVEQVGETRNLPDTVFQKIRPQLVASPILRKLAINQMDAEELGSHPYLSARQARVLVNYRDQHGPYLSVADVAKTRIFEAAEIEKLAPYLDFR